MTSDSFGREEKRRPGYMYHPDAPLPEHLRPKPEAPVESKLRDFDSAESLFRIKAALWSVIGSAIGGGLGLWYSLLTGKAPLLYVLLFAAVMWAVVFFGVLLLGERVARIGASVYFHDGSTTPARREYSLAESLAARGRYEQAVEEYENNAALYPNDPEPLLRLARLQRDELRQPAAAAESFQRALAAGGVTPGLEVLLRRELVELYLRRLHDPRRALPELTHLAASGRTSAEVAWARRELEAVRRTLERDQADA